MSSSSPKLDQIKIQTARMLEIYALLRKELDENKGLLLSPTKLSQLSAAVDKIEANMRQLQTQFSGQQEVSSEEDRRNNTELDEIVNAVLKWHTEEEP